MKLEPAYDNRLAEISGRLPNGQPKLRIVTPEEAVRPHGKMQGLPKYLDPETGIQMPFLVLEMWISPELCGSRESWQYDLLGPYPADCPLDCCNHGYWGMKSPLTTAGEIIPLSESLIDSICRKQYMDIAFSALSEKERLESLDASLSERNKKAEETAWAEFNENLDHYATHKTQEDNADNRVIIGLGKNAFSDYVKGGKSPIGRPV